MKICSLVVAFALVLCLGSAEALSLVCEPYPAGEWQPEEFVYQIQTGIDAEGNPIWGDEITSKAVPFTGIGGAVWLHLDIIDWPKGATTMHVKARKITPPLTVEESEYCLPFVLTKTSTAKTPGGFGLAE